MERRGGAGKTLTTPPAAAVAGIVFSVLLTTSLLIVHLTMRANSGQAGHVLADPAHRQALKIAFQLVPIAAIAFLWCMGVLRNRFGTYEDQFFATVFLGSGLGFVASLFCATAIAGALLQDPGLANGAPTNPEVYAFARRTAWAFMNIFAIKMAATFMFSTCTIALRTGILPRWLIFSGFGCGIVLLVVYSSTWPGAALVFPAWMFLLSVYILINRWLDTRASRRALAEA
ncbi:MAG TPA: hypothetical protein VKB79_21555 [Bryobacteraceae bacterium]|nr:hypothetical protein [Bryobacteraceae bacterium]